MSKFGFELRRTKREDGSVIIDSQALPMFYVMGKDADEAWQVACKLLPDYLSANYPEFVSWHTFESLSKLLPIDRERSSLSPVYVIAEMEAKQRAQDIDRVS